MDGLLSSQPFLRRALGLHLSWTPPQGAHCGCRWVGRGRLQMMAGALLLRPCIVSWRFVANTPNPATHNPRGGSLGVWLPGGSLVLAGITHAFVAGCTLRGASCDLVFVGSWRRQGEGGLSWAMGLSGACVPASRPVQAAHRGCGSSKRAQRPRGPRPGPGRAAVTSAEFYCQSGPRGSQLSRRGNRLRLPRLGAGGRGAGHFAISWPSVSELLAFPLPRTTWETWL